LGDVCVQVRTVVRRSPASLSGRLQAADERPPAAGLRIVLQSPAKTFETRSDAAGHFRFDGLEDGEYVLAINPDNVPTPSSADGVDAGLRYPASFYPGAASRDPIQRIRIERRAHATLATPWTLPPLIEERRIEALFLWPAGRRAHEARYVVKDKHTGRTTAAGAAVESTGVIRFHALAGRSYLLEAQARDAAGRTYFSGAAEIGPDFTGRSTVKLAEDGPQPRFPIRW